VKQYEKMFNLEGKTLSIDEGVLDTIVQRAIDLELGARGLRSIIEAIMLDLMYEMPDSKEEHYHITVDLAEEKLSAANLIDFRQAG